tara:strand:- start:204 stop:626 length:423 start_codon:yes stop_codon:yes gene_type:complete
MFRNLFLLAFILTPSVAYSADPGKFSTLAVNEPAPFEGVLFDPLATATMLARSEFYKDECELETQYRLDIQSTEFQLERQELNLRLGALTNEHTLLITEKDLEIEQLQKAILTQSPRNNWIWGATGVVLGGAVVYAITNK